MAGMGTASPIKPESEIKDQATPQPTPTQEA